jgi:N6-L-threonylcarbamoyladenine synthase
VRAAGEYGATETWIAGGVSANQALRQAMTDASPMPVRCPPLKLCGDNAAMIASAGYFRYERGYHDDLDMDVRPLWPLVAVQPIHSA